MPQSHNPPLCQHHNVELAEGETGERENKKNKNPRQAGLEQRTVAQDMDMFMKLRNETRLCRPLKELCASLQDTCLPKVPTYLWVTAQVTYSG